MTFCKIVQALSCDFENTKNKYTRLLFRISMWHLENRFFPWKPIAGTVLSIGNLRDIYVSVLLGVGYVLFFICRQMSTQTHANNSNGYTVDLMAAATPEIILEKNNVSSPTGMMAV